MWHLPRLFSSPRSPPPASIGLDINDSGARLVHLAHGPAVTLRSQLQISWIDIDNPDHATPWPADAAMHIHQAWQQLDTSDRRVVIALPATEVRYQVVAMPDMPRHALETTLESEAADLLGLAATAISVDHQPVANQQDDPSADMSHWLLCAAPMAAVSRRMSLVRQAGLEIRRIEPEIFALLRLAAHQPAWQASRYASRALLLHSAQAIHCHLLPAGAMLPEQPACELAADGEALPEHLALHAVVAIMLAGEGWDPLMPRLQQQLPTMHVLSDPLAGLACSSQETNGLRRAVTALSIACGLALWTPA